MRRARLAAYSVGTKHLSTPVLNQVLWQVVRSVTTVAKGMCRPPFNLRKYITFQYRLRGSGSTAVSPPSFTKMILKMQKEKETSNRKLTKLRKHIEINNKKLIIVAHIAYWLLLWSPFTWSIVGIIST